MTNLELFTDLVFVFAITQLTTLLTSDQTPRGVLEVLLIFGVLWWMFGGYVFLTNAMSLTGKGRRLLVLVAMMGFLAIALAIPTAFHGGGLLFGLGYLVVIVVHAGLFTFTSGGRIADIARFAPMNIVGAVLVLIAGLVPDAAYALFSLALLGQVISSVVSARGLTMRIRAGHFVERYGLLVLIVLGESIVAIGVGAAGLELDAQLVVASLLALSITSALWWLYFSGDDVRAERALASAEPRRQLTIALGAFFYSTIPMLLGVVAFAAGVKSAIAHVSDHVTIETALALAVGPALYLIGGAMLRRWIGVVDTRRVYAAALCLATFPIGIATRASIEMLVILGVLVLLITVESRTREIPASPHTPR